MPAAQPATLPRPAFPRAPIVVRATEIDAGWALPDAVDDADDCIPIDDADVIEIRPLAD